MRPRAQHIPTFILHLSLYTLSGLMVYLLWHTQYTPNDELTSLRLAILFLFAPIIVKYLLHLFVAPWYPLFMQRRTEVSGASELPSVSVLIPAWNEAVGIAHTLKSVLDTHYPRLELVVVNDGSTDDTHIVITQFIADHQAASTNPTPIKYLDQPNSGKAKALNHALVAASGEIIVTVDADSVMHPRTIHNLVKHYHDTRVASVAGNVAIGNRTRPIGLVQQIEYLYGFYFKRADAILNAVYIVGGAAASYRREILVESGSFDEVIITEDIELSTRLQDLGYKVDYAADAIVYTEGPSDFSGLCKQRLRWKFGRLQTFWKYRHLFFSLRAHHNWYLTCLILPVALFAEVLLFFEGLLLSAFFYYTFTTNDYLPLVTVIAILTVVVWAQILSDPQRRYHANLFWLAPGAWLIFYFIDFVEYQALIRSIKRFITRQPLSWQRWQRVGVFNS